MIEQHLYQCSGKYCPGYTYPVPHPPTCADRRLTPRPSYHRGVIAWVPKAMVWAVRKGGATVSLPRVKRTWWDSRAKATLALLAAGYSVDYKGHVYEVPA